LQLLNLGNSDLTITLPNLNNNNPYLGIRKPREGESKEVETSPVVIQTRWYKSGSIRYGIKLLSRENKMQFATMTDSRRLIWEPPYSTFFTADQADGYRLQHTVDLELTGLTPDELGSRSNINVKILDGLLDNRYNLSHELDCGNLLRRVHNIQGSENNSKKRMTPVQFQEPLPKRIRSTHSLERLHCRIEHASVPGQPAEFVPHSKSVMTLSLTPRRKRKLPLTQSFTIPCGRDWRCDPPFDLDGKKFQLSLVDLWLPFTYQNIFEKEMWFAVDQTGKLSSDTAVLEKDRIYIPADRYQKVDDIVFFMNKKLAAYYLGLTLKQGIWTLQCTSASRRSNSILVMNDAMSQMWGHPTSAGREVRITIPFREFIRLEGKARVNVNAGFMLMYVWCDLLKDQVVGDIRGPILHLLVPEYKNGNEAVTDWSTEPTNPISCELADHISTICEIHIRITDSLGHDLTYKNEQLPRPTCTLRLTTN
jgi:hypothetical protein